MKMSIARVAPFTVLIGGCSACAGQPGADPPRDGQRPPGEGETDPLWVLYLDQGRVELEQVSRPASWQSFARLCSSRLVCMPAPSGCRLAE
jgi:hypothetical protein